MIAGQNNCGKSALIDYLIKVVGAISGQGVIRKEDNPLTQGDRPLKGIDLQCSPTISFCVDIEALKEKFEASTRDLFRQSYASDFAKLFRGTPYAAKGASSAWIDFKLERGKVVRGYDDTLNALYSQYETEGGTINLSDASLKICGNASDNQINYANVISAAMPWESLPSFLKVGAIRSIKDSDASGNKGDVNSGLGLPSALLRLYNPERKDFEESKQRWNKLQGFVRDVLNDPGASILVSHDSHEIAVKTTDTDYLPLESLCTGVTELLILAAVVACNSSKIICIEEPEIHLHPAL